MGKSKKNRPINKDVAEYLWLMQKKIEQLTGQPFVKSIYDFQSDSDLNDSMTSENTEEALQEVCVKVYFEMGLIEVSTVYVLPRFTCIVTKKIIPSNTCYGHFVIVLIMQLRMTINDIICMMFLVISKRVLMLVCC